MLQQGSKPDVHRILDAIIVCLVEETDVVDMVKLALLWENHYTDIILLPPCHTVSEFLGEVKNLGLTG